MKTSRVLACFLLSLDLLTLAIIDKTQISNYPFVEQVQDGALTTTTSATIHTVTNPSGSMPTTTKATTPISNIEEAMSGHLPHPVTTTTDNTIPSNFDDPNQDYVQVHSRDATTLFIPNFGDDGISINTISGVASITLLGGLFALNISPTEHKLRLGKFEIETRKLPRIPNRLNMYHDPDESRMVINISEDDLISNESDSEVKNFAKPTLISRNDILPTLEIATLSHDENNVTKPKQSLPDNDLPFLEEVHHNRMRRNIDSSVVTFNHLSNDLPFLEEILVKKAKKNTSATERNDSSKSIFDYFPDFQLFLGLMDIYKNKKDGAALKLANGILAAGVDTQGNPFVSVNGQLFQLILKED